jgi:hypothetical protein
MDRSREIVDEIGNEENELPSNVIHASNMLQRVIEKRYRKLDLSGRALTDMHLDIIVNDSPNIYTLSSCLWELDLSRNNITFVPNCIEEIYGLERLIVTNNDIKEIPNIRLMGILKLLSLGNNKIANWPTDLKYFSHLKILELDHNLLVDVPPEIFHLSNLVRLNLSNNQIVTLPREIGRCTSRKDLHLDSNRLMYLPFEIRNLKSLSKITLDRNDWVPGDVGERQNYFDTNCTIHKELTLRELVSRHIYSNRLTLSDTVSQNHFNYMNTPMRCTYCDEVFFHCYVEYVANRKILEVQRAAVPVAIRVCSRDCWESDRVNTPF